MAKYNDLDPKKWKDYEDINTDSLWIIDKRDNSGAHHGKASQAHAAGRADRLAGQPVQSIG
jgi:hypothetical protein